MKLTLLVDNHTIIDRYFIGEPAISYYIEIADQKILFDTGYSDVYLTNAKKLGIDMTQIDTLVLSHAHDDHTGGLSAFPKGERKPRLVAHPLIWESREYEGASAGIPVSREDVEKRFRPELTDRPLEIAPGLFYLGEIERSNDFENKVPVGTRLHNGVQIPDLLPDDSALAYVGKDGLYIITGCSHSGICNIIEYAKKVTGVDTVQGVIGGFHLMDAENVQTKRTVEYFAKAHVPGMYPCHCTCFAARAALHRKTPLQEVGAGTILEWD